MKPSEFILKRESEWEEEYDDVEFATEEDIGNMYVELDKLFISKEHAKKELKRLFRQTNLNQFIVDDIINEVLK